MQSLSSSKADGVTEAVRRIVNRWSTWSEAFLEDTAYSSMASRERRASGGVGSV